MTDRKLRHLSRTELVDIIYELQKRNEEKDAQIRELQAALEDRTIRISKAGSIAEAAISINRVLEAAQAAADQYLASAMVAAADMERRLAEAEKGSREDPDDIQLQATRLAR